MKNILMKEHSIKREFLPICIVFMLVIFVLASCTNEVIEPVDPKSGVTVPGFPTHSLVVAENSATGILIQFHLSKPPQQDTVIRFYSTNYYTGNGTFEMIGSVYTTIPETIIQIDYNWYEVFIPVLVAKGETKVEFTVMPIDNKVINKYYPILEFGCVGLEIFSCTVTIVDDE